MPRAQPSRQPKAVAAGLEGNRDAADSMARLDGLLTPPLKQRQQPVRIGGLLLERPAHQARHQTPPAGC